MQMIDISIQYTQYLLTLARRQLQGGIRGKQVFLLANCLQQLTVAINPFVGRNPANHKAHHKALKIYKKTYHKTLLMTMILHEIVEGWRYPSTIVKQIEPFKHI